MIDDSFNCVPIRRTSLDEDYEIFLKGKKEAKELAELITGCLGAIDDDDMTDTDSSSSVHSIEGSTSYDVGNSEHSTPVTRVNEKEVSVGTKHIECMDEVPVLLPDDTEISKDNNATKIMESRKRSLHTMIPDNDESFWKYDSSSDVSCESDSDHTKSIRTTILDDEESILKQEFLSTFDKVIINNKCFVIINLNFICSIES
jgi:hypothetical protein